MNKKYKFTGKTKQYLNFRLHQIQALKNFGSVKEGDIGGWIEKEENLSHEGDCWVYGYAQVYRSAWVGGDAQVYGHAQVFGRAKVCGNAQVFGDAQVYGNAWVYENAQVYGSARVHGDAFVFGDAQVHGDAWVYENAQVHGDSKVSGSDRVSKNLKTSSDNLPEELSALPEGVEEVVLKGVKYKKVTVTTIKWEKA